MQKALDRMIAVAGSALVLIPGSVWAETPSDADRYVYGPRMMWWDGGWSGMFLGPLFMIVVLAVVIAIAVLVVRWISGPWQGAPLHQPQPSPTPLDILKERFARGEIDKNEYDERRRVLGE
jgi:putative membrane protein